jgi:hypothetical protein
VGAAVGSSVAAGAAGAAGSSAAGASAGAAGWQAVKSMTASTIRKATFLNIFSPYLGIFGLLAEFSMRYNGGTRGCLSLMGIFARSACFETPIKKRALPLLKDNSITFLSAHLLFCSSFSRNRQTTPTDNPTNTIYLPQGYGVWTPISMISHLEKVEFPLPNKTEQTPPLH